MDTRTLYNQWSATYDSQENKTRDLEKKAGQQMLQEVVCNHVLELGCGTGKNTVWLSEKAGRLMAVDLSEEMMAKAKEKVGSSHVSFVQADITKPWDFVAEKPDLITCSLILEHIQNLDFIFEQAAAVLQPHGKFYICELHSYKQYSGSKARFDTAEGIQVLDCFIHHISDYFSSAAKHNFSCIALQEWFDGDDRNLLPRLISFLFHKRD